MQFRDSYLRADSLQGAWSEDKPHGDGQYFYRASGARYRGQWREGEWHGTGTYTEGEGTATDGVWRGGLLVPLWQRRQCGENMGRTDTFGESIEVSSAKAQRARDAAATAKAAGSAVGSAGAAGDAAVPPSKLSLSEQMARKARTFTKGSSPLSVEG